MSLISRTFVADGICGTHRYVTNVVIVEDARAVSSSLDRTVRLWDLASGAMLAIFTGESEIRSLAVTRGGTIVAGEQSGPSAFPAHPRIAPASVKRGTNVSSSCSSPKHQPRPNRDPGREGLNTILASTQREALGRLEPSCGRRTYVLRMGDLPRC
jgi:WD40 repeat protein